MEMLEPDPDPYTMNTGDPQPCPPPTPSSPNWFPFKRSMATFTWVSLSDLHFSKKMTFHRSGDRNLEFIQ
jgi:hypothetical protein